MSSKGAPRPLPAGLALGGGLALLALGGAAGAATSLDEPRVSFRFGAGATLFARPGVGPSGDVYVGTGDGYVHALSPQGGYRWSYTVKGRVVAPPVEDPVSRRAFVLTSEARLYALERDARLRWVSRLPAAPKSEIALTSKGTLLFVGQDEHLYGVTTGGALVLRLSARGPRSAPVALHDGRVMLVLSDSLAILKGHGYERAPLPGPFGGAARLALDAGGGISSCEDGAWRVTGAGTELDVAGDCASPPILGDGFVAVAETSGVVRLRYASGATRTLRAGRSALRPVWDAPRRRLILSNSTGAVSIVELPARELPRDADRG